MELSVYISNLSLLGPYDLAAGLLTGTWPSVDELIDRAKRVGASGLQLTMLRGWDTVHVQGRIAWEDMEKPGFVCAIEGPWHGTTSDPGLIGGRLFGTKSYNDTITLIALLERIGMHPLTVDMEPYPNSCIEIADLPGRASEIQAALAGDNLSSRGLVYDTWHAREVLPDSRREDWMRSPLVDLYKEPDWNKMYFLDRSFRVTTNKLLTDHFWRVDHKVKMFQVQTRSKTELERFFAGHSTMLSYQVALIREYLRYNKDCPVPVVVEGMPYWSNDVQRRFVEKVKDKLV